MVHQRDIVEIAFDEEFGGNHPAVVISNKLVQEVEGFFVCVMITSKEHDDEFSFILTDEMVMNPLSKDHCEVRCHLLNFVPSEAIIANRHNNSIKIEPFNSLIRKITETTFATGEL